MLQLISTAFLVSLGGCAGLDFNMTYPDTDYVEIVESTTAWRRKKPAYWEFPDTTTSERPDASAELCKSVDMDELGANITRLVTAPVRGQAEPLLRAVVLYVLTLHRFIRKSGAANATDEIAVRMAEDLVKNKRPAFLDMDLDMPVVKSRAGFDKYEFQHFTLVWEDIHRSWLKLKGILFGESSVSTTATPRKGKKDEGSEELDKHLPYKDLDGMLSS